jgi:hypothetical protein
MRFKSNNVAPKAPIIKVSEHCWGIMNYLVCDKCGSRKNPSPNPVVSCVCGGVWMLSLSDNIQQQVDSFRAVAKEGAKRVAELKGGLSESDDGTYATTQQTIDRVEKTYRKKVILSDGTVVKDVYGSLNDQNLHGPQKQNS